MVSRVFAFCVVVTCAAASAHAGSPFDAWIAEQTLLLPVAHRVSTPRVAIEVDDDTRAQLDVRAEPLARNVFITTTYTTMARELATCLGAGDRVGNWYHFATWASVSGGEFMRGEKVEKLAATDRVALEVGTMVGVVPPESRRVGAMADANVLIALEMVPIGRAFLDRFCGDDDDGRAFSEFAALFQPRHDNERVLLHAFELYWLAIHTEDRRAKIELTTAASILQVVSEQTRVDPLIKAFFGSDTSLELARELYVNSATRVGSLHLGAAMPARVQLFEDVPAVHLHAELRTVTRPELRQVNDELGIPNDLEAGVLSFAGTAAPDWTSLAARKRFLAALFRGYGGVDRLFEVPSDALISFDSPPHHAMGAPR